MWHKFQNKTNLSPPRFRRLFILFNFLPFPFPLLNIINIKLNHKRAINKRKWSINWLKRRISVENFQWWLQNKQSFKDSSEENFPSSDVSILQVLILSRKSHFYGLKTFHFLRKRKQKFHRWKVEMQSEVSFFSLQNIFNFFSAIENKVFFSSRKKEKSLIGFSSFSEKIVKIFALKLFPFANLWAFTSSHVFGLCMINKPGKGFCRSEGFIIRFRVWDETWKDKTFSFLFLL